MVLAPATVDLAKAEVELASKMGREMALRRALEPVQESFDVVLIDTSPNLGILTANSLVAARYVLVPVSAEFLPMLGLQLLAETVEEVRTNLQQPLEVLGYLITMYDRRLSITEEVLKQLEKQYGAGILKSRVRVNANLKASPAHRKDIFQFEADTKKPWKGVEDFEALTNEFQARLRKKSAAQPGQPEGATMSRPKLPENVFGESPLRSTTEAKRVSIVPQPEAREISRAPSTDVPGVAPELAAVEPVRRPSPSPSKPAARKKAEETAPPERNEKLTIYLALHHFDAIEEEVFRRRRAGERIGNTDLIREIVETWHSRRKVSQRAGDRPAGPRTEPVLERDPADDVAPSEKTSS